MTEPLIKLWGINYLRHQKQILRDAALTVQPGEIVTLIGPNGAGKSTLVRIAIGLLTPDAGHVEHGRNLSIGYMPQKMAIDPSFPLTVERFLKLAGNDNHRITECLTLTGTGDLRRQAVHSLSGGELQRVMLARAIYRKPQLLVLDEPVQGVDVAGQSTLYRLIGKIRDDTGCGVLMVSHDLHLVMAATDRVICLNQHVCCEGHPDNVAHDPAFLHLFGDLQAADVVHYTHHHNHSHNQHHHGQGNTSTSLTES